MTADARIDLAIEAYVAEFGVPETAPTVTAAADVSADGHSYSVLMDEYGVLAVYRSAGSGGVERVGLDQWPTDVLAWYLGGKTYDEMFGQ